MKSSWQHREAEEISVLATIGKDKMILKHGSGCLTITQRFLLQWFAQSCNRDLVVPRVKNICYLAFYTFATLWKSWKDRLEIIVQCDIPSCSQQQNSPSVPQDSFSLTKLGCCVFSQNSTISHISHCLNVLERLDKIKTTSIKSCTNSFTE